MLTAEHWRTTAHIFFQGLIDAHEQFKSTLGEADREYKGIVGLCTEAAQLASQYGLLNENPYTTLQGDAITTKWMEVQQLVPNRDQTLHGEMLKQQNNERLRRTFAQKANVVGPWVEKHLGEYSGLVSCSCIAESELVIGGKCSNGEIGKKTVF